MKTTALSGSGLPGPFVSSILRDILLTLITCGLYNIIIQHRQILALNSILKSQKYSFGKWAFFTLITCGIYHIYHNYIMARDLCSVFSGAHPNEPLICLALGCFGFTPVADAIIQNSINRYFGGPSL